ncbi:MAG: NAD-dependent epimerase/dehydratase family protein [Gemmatimonadetes bacterium]|nr:NAD-dependent epimerase/dehydratase family protein [Gemmatimonadota bacterium]
MNPTRRDFLKTSAAAGGALGLGLAAAPFRPARGQAQAGPRSAGQAAPMRILILGGTSFLGPHQIRYALERGHSITTFTRGQTTPRMFPEVFDRVEQLVGDRENDLRALEGRTWDAVIDNSGQRVEWARDSAQLLENATESYLFVSSTGVYLPYLTTDLEETTQPLLADDPPRDQPSYGVMKALSEIEVEKAYGERALVIRPQYIVGPGDRSDRFPYWPMRMERGGEILVPGKKDDQVMLIDVRDLTEWMIHLLENRVTGVYNAAGPASRLSMAEFVYGVRACFSTSLSFTWIEDYEFLMEHRLRYAIPWVMPVENALGQAQINIDKALAAGLTFRPLATTTTDVFDWWYSDAVDEEHRQNPRFVLTPERDAEILAAWKARAP